MPIVSFNVLPFPRDAFLKEHSVLAGAGEAYDADKLTPENFLNFYKKTYVSNKIQEDENYYILFSFQTIAFNNSVIEHLPFKKSTHYIKLKEEMKIVMVKDVFDYQLEEFAKVVMEFGHCFKLETYYENYRLVFKVNQAVFNEVLNSSIILKQKLETEYIGQIFTPIFNFFNKRTSDLQDTLKGADAVSNNVKYKVNYTKNEKSLTIKLLHKGRVYSYNDISLNYLTFKNNEFNFYYSFFINVMGKDINVDKNKYFFYK